jgi:hypothetical protein
MQWTDQLTIFQVAIAEISIGMCTGARDRSDITHVIADSDMVPIDIDPEDGAGGQIGQHSDSFELAHEHASRVNPAAAPFD